MNTKPSPIISTEELRFLIHNHDFVLIDARAGVGAKDKYLKEHIAGARFVDLETDLAEHTNTPSIGGRHPLPAIEKFVLVLNKVGISPHSHVVVYDDKNGSNAAARFWWMLRSAGHKNIQVLDGGYDAAARAGIPLRSNEEPPVESENYSAKSWNLPMADIVKVEKIALDKNYLLIDVRDAYRYDGEKEPIDLIAGHIPGAVNIPLTSNLNADGFFLSREELKQKYFHVMANRSTENVIVHCGSGVTACHTILAMDYAGLGIPSLYVGSWSEWSRNEKPVGTNKND